MACLVSLKFSLPNTSLSPTYMVLNSKTPTRYVILSLLLPRAKVEITSPACSSKSISRFRPRQDFRCHVGVVSRDIFNAVSLLSDVRFPPQVLTGYWIGPDVEDGWGFVEAFIHEIL